MSTLKVNNIGKTSGSTQDTMAGMAKAWVNFNGTGTIASYDSLNTSSLVDDGSGRYTVNINSDMSNTNYGITTGGNNSLTGFVGRVASPANTKTSGVYGIETVNNGGSAFEDYQYIMTAVNGDLS